MTLVCSGKFNRLRTVPDKKPRTECACQPVAPINSASVAPSLRPKSASTIADLVRFAPCSGLGFRGLEARLAAGADWKDRERLRVLAAPVDALGRDDRFAVFGFGLLSPFLAWVIWVLLSFWAGPDVQPPHCRKPGRFGRRIR